MPIDANALSALAAEYANGMTRIRGRRVQRLLKREFAGAEYVLIVKLASGGSAVLGLSERGAAFLATDGRGSHASVGKWLHGSTQATEFQFNLLKDSLPVLQTRTISLTGLPRRSVLNIPVGAIPPQASGLLAIALRALA
jgi:hypothetical protein